VSPCELFSRELVHQKGPDNDLGLSGLLRPLAVCEMCAGGHQPSHPVNGAHLPIPIHSLRLRRSRACILLLLYLPACTSWHVGSPTPAQFVERERPERARVTRTDGSQIVLEHIVLRADTLAGTVHGQDQQQDVRIPLTDVRQVATRRFSAGRTVGLVVVSLFVTYAALVTAACNAGEC